VANWSKIARRIRVPSGFAFAAVYLILARPTAIYLAIGGVFIVAGLAIRAIASGHLQKNEVLATTGPYAYTRNPLYFGSLIMAVGFTIAARSFWIALILAILLFAIYLPVIRDEESYLADHFPEFTTYAAEVPRFVPRLRHNAHAHLSFSWDLYRKHREYNALLGSIVLIGALLAKMIWISC